MNGEQERQTPVTARIKLTLCTQEGFFGPGVCELLEKIRETGSIQAAAARMEMSYTKAWRILKRAEEEMGVPLVNRVAGGKNGGSSVLTGAGEEAVRGFREMEQKVAAYADELMRSDGVFRRGPGAGAARTIQYRTGDGTMPDFYESIAKAEQPMTAAWIIDGPGAGARALCGREGILFRDEQFPEALAGMIRTGGQGILESAGSRVFAERITDGKKLVICGAGHVALRLIRIAATLGYGITVIEDREEYAGKARDAGAQRVECRPFGEALDEMPDDPLTAYVIMTREHAHDMECLRRILRKDIAYAGMMGSRSRTEQVRQQMLEEGFDAGKVAQVHMPIGLPISSRTPEEIAVSVAAELISVLNAADPGEGFPPGMAEELAAAPQGVLAMIVEKEGEAPRRPGTKMLIRADGSFLGTVGGGYAEAIILKTAKQMIRAGSRESRLVRITMEKGAMHCGGEITVFLTAV